jgi:hypothetical protein
LPPKKRSAILKVVLGLKIERLWMGLQFLNVEGGQAWRL